MFSGLVVAVGTVRSLRRIGGGGRIEVSCGLSGEPLQAGESIAVSGPCLTVAEVDPTGFIADVSPETMARTTLADLRGGDRANIERSLRLTDRLGGHLVLGHVDVVTTVIAASREAGFWRLRFALPRAVEAEVAEKGSVAVDGVSLTVARVGEGWFEAALIPATLKATTLGDRRPGDRVNLETDVLAKYVRRVLRGERPSIASLLGEGGDEKD